MIIRKILLVQLICLSSIFYCYAGTGTGTGSFTLGADAGPGFSALYGPNPYISFVSNLHLVELSASAGINFWYNFPKIISIGSGIYFYQFGYNRYRSSDTIIYDYHSRGAWNTINIPLLARVSFGKKVVFFAEAGPFLSIGLNRAYLLSGFAGYNGTAQTIWYSLNQVNTGITAGAGIEVPLPHRFALSFETRSNVGLENLNSSSVYSIGYGNSVKTYSCTLLCGFNYTLPVRARKVKTAGWG